ncbi:MAG: DUF1326 domain-containing protein, partial [Planctomycetaceae bacterium]|nr:DUF1326 domain-containing protein [Planctomycetaceae bacterium]
KGMLIDPSASSLRTVSMRLLATLACGVCLCGSTLASAATITGEYLEARSCDVYTGPCFANAEMDLAGKEALMAWKVDRGSWNGVSLDGLSVAVVANSEKTMGNTGVFKMQAGKIRSVVLLDQRASKEQQAALLAFVKESASEYTGNVVEVRQVAMTLENDHLDGRGVFTAGDVARIETRALAKGDCVCTNEMIFYQPLTKVRDFSPAYTVTHSYTGDALDNTWTMHSQRSAFLATFRR